MDKLVILELDGSWETGFRAILEISEAHQRYLARTRGSLPPNTTLRQKLRDHWQKLRELGFNQRIRPTRIVRHKPIEEEVQDCKISAYSLQNCLHEWLNHPEFQPILNSLREELSLTEKARFLLRVEDSDLQKLPWSEWEFLQRYDRLEISLSPLELRPQVTALPQSNHTAVRILAVFGNSEGICLDEDRNILQSLLNAEVEFLDEPSVEILTNNLWEKTWDIIFFAGHSETNNNTGIINLNATETITVDDLWTGLKRAANNGLRLAIFNSCDGLGWSRQLNDSLIPQMIVMREVVPDKVAQTFLRHFLTNFANGESFYTSVKVARERLQNVRFSYQNSDGDTVEFEYPCATWLPAICENPAAIPPSWQRWIKRSKVSLSWKRSLRFVLIASLVITTIIFWGRWQGHLQPLELKAYDYLMQQRPLLPPDERIVVIGVTDDDRKLLNQLPEETERGARTLSDSELDQVMAKLQNLDPAVIGLYFAFKGTIQPEFPYLKSSLESDRLIGVCMTNNEVDFGTNGFPPPDDIASDRVGFIDMMPDYDDTIRRNLVGMYVRDRFPCRGNNVESFSLKVAQKYLSDRGYEYSFEPNKFMSFGDIRFEFIKQHRGAYHQESSEVEEGYQLMLNYRPYQNFMEDIVPVRTLTELLEGQLTREQVQNKIVLLGKITTSHQTEKTPYSQTSSQHLPIVLLQAQKVSNLIGVVNQELPIITTWYWWGDAIWLWFWSLVGGGSMLAILARWKEPINAIAACFVVMSSLVFLLYWVCLFSLLQGLWLAFIPALLVLVLSAGTISFYKLLKDKYKQLD